MYKCQQSLIKHLKTNFKKPAVQTIEEYAGQINTEAQEISCLLPASLIMFISSVPTAQENAHQFDLLIITQSRSLDRNTNRNNNIQLVSDIAAWLKSNYLFQTYDDSGTYEIDRDFTNANIILLDKRFCIIALSLQIFDHTN